uniref:Uncharacterized protein n=1 Tax=Poecilia mexicana TaxID=48701 RepID=A0A3B3XCQ8_9TELE
MLLFLLQIFFLPFFYFLRCNPAGGQANCVTQQSAEMPWSPELPSKLPASDKEAGRKPEREEL